MRLSGTLHIPKAPLPQLSPPSSGTLQQIQGWTLLRISRSKAINRRHLHLMTCRREALRAANLSVDFQITRYTSIGSPERTRLFKSLSPAALEFLGRAISLASEAAGLIIVSARKHPMYFYGLGTNRAAALRRDTPKKLLMRLLKTRQRPLRSLLHRYSRDSLLAQVHFSDGLITSNVHSSATIVEVDTPAHGLWWDSQ
jgi:hypothetical protein